MTIIIKDINDIELFKKYLNNYPDQPICYIFYKNNMRFPNVHYVGFTIQYGINKFNYLKNHHIMGNIFTNLNDGYSIQIYTKYSEKGLVNFLKPTLNRQSGSGMNNYRDCCNGDLRSIGIIINNYLDKKYNIDEQFDYFNIKLGGIINVSIHRINIASKSNTNFKLMCIIEKLKKLEMSISGLEIINDPIFNMVDYKNKHFNKNGSYILNYERLFSILANCKLDKIYLSYIIIHEIYKKHILVYMNNNEKKCSCGKVYKENRLLIKHVEKEKHKEKWIMMLNLKKTSICKDIFEELKQKDYFASYSNNNLWYYYQLLLL